MAMNSYTKTVWVNDGPPDINADNLNHMESGISDNRDAIISIQGDLATDEGAITQLQTDVSGKVDKVQGKGLSTNDYTDNEKTKLSGIAAGAQVNVKSNWNDNDSSSDAFIQNKPSIPSKTSDLTNDSSFITAAEAPLQGVKGDAETDYRTGNVNITKANVGLGNVTNDAQVKRTEMGVAGGVATLDSGGKVPSAQLPSYVDDVLEYASTSAFPGTGEAGKIYVALDTNKTYRWGGSSYAEISESLALGETSSTAYRGDRGKTAYDHSQVASGNPHNVSASDVGLGNVDNTSDANKPVSNAMQTALDGKKAKQSAVTDPAASGTALAFIDSITQDSGGVITPTKKNVKVDTEITKNSNNPIASGAVYSAFENIVDNTFTAMLDMTNTTAVFKAWYAMASLKESNRFNLLERFANMMASACGDITFTLRNYKHTVSSDPTMTPLDDLAQYSAGQLCTEATTPVSDWPDEHPIGGWYIRAQALSLQNGKMNVVAIEGIDDSFDETGEEAPVYCFCMSPWIKEWDDTDYEYTSFRANQDEGETYRPMAEAVDFVDNSKRNLTWHPAYGGSLNSGGALTSGTGRKLCNFRSANNGITDARKMTAYEGLWTDCDTEFLLKMWQLRHFNLENSGIAEGCTNYNYQYKAAVGETGVKRVLLTTAQAANLVVGSTVSVGEMGENTGMDRGNAYMRNLCDSVKISSIEAVEISGTTYAAVNLDIEDTITTTVTTAISTWPWISGATDALPGHKDGCFHSLTAGKGPLRVMGIEVLNGAYVIGLDPLWSVTSGEYKIYSVRDSQKQAGSVSNDHELVMTRSALVVSSTWTYIKHLIKNVIGIVFPDVGDGSSSTYFKSAFYWYTGTGLYVPWRFCALYHSGFAGLAGAFGYLDPGITVWYGAPRLSFDQCWL